MRALLIGLGLVMMTLALGCSSSAQKPASAPTPTPTVAPGKPAPATPTPTTATGNQTFATPTPILVPIRHPTPTPYPTAVPTPVARVTVDELTKQIEANPERYKNGDELIVVGFVMEAREKNWAMEAPAGWVIRIEFPTRYNPPSVKPGDMVEIRMTIIYAMTDGRGGGVSARNASVFKVTKW